MFGGSLSDHFIFDAGHGHDIIADFESIDVLLLDQALVGAGLTAQQVIDLYGTMVNGQAMLDFGNDSILFSNLTDPQDLIGSILLF